MCTVCLALLVWRRSSGSAQRLCAGCWSRAQRETATAIESERRSGDWHCVVVASPWCRCSFPLVPVGPVQRGRSGERVRVGRQRRQRVVVAALRCAALRCGGGWLAQRSLVQWRFATLGHSDDKDSQKCGDGKRDEQPTRMETLGAASNSSAASARSNKATTRGWVAKKRQSHCDTWRELRETTEREQWRERGGRKSRQRASDGENASG